MNILISGAEVRDASRGNRGAEQLLRSATARVQAMGFDPAVTIRQVDGQLRGELGLKEYVGNPRISRLDRVIPRVDISGFSTLRSYRGALDASGFALGDAWGPHTASWVMRKYTQWKERGLKIVALPQAYGGFSEPEVRSVSKRALGLCDLIFAREEESYQHLVDLGVDETRVRVCPDITIAEGTAAGVEERKNRLVIVPNWNLAERTDRTSYLECLTGAAHWGQEQGYEVVGLLHEGSKDLAILESVAAQAPIEILSDLTGWETKSYISESRLVLAGRYHAVVSALSTQTPVVTHSWSHKYRELLRQFGVEEWIRDPGNRSSTIAGLMELQGADTYALYRSKKPLVDQIELMWAEVSELLAG